ncbi:MAG TPA: ABC transporter substrate-binding protein [Minicystis sp.]|nr:ABC transporter substrate-binding protein [Minicystis sp.]
MLAAACAAAYAVARAGRSATPPSPASSASGATAAAAGPKLRVGVPLNCYAALLVLAEQKGLFAREGLDVELVPFRDGKKSFKGMLAGEADASLVGDLHIAAIGDARQDFRVLARLGRSEFDRWIVARRDIHAVAELRDKTIGTQKRSGAAYVLDGILARNGLHQGDVRVVDVGERDMGRRLRNGQLDAFVVPRPYVGPLKQHFHVDATELVDRDGYRTAFALVARPEIAAARRADAEKLLRAVAAAADAIHADPASAFEIVTHAPVLGGRPMLDECKSLTFDVGLDDAFVARLQAEGDWFAKASGRGPAPDFSTLVAPEPLAAARPAAVHVEKE